VPRFEALIRDVNAVGHLSWVIHVGDVLRPTNFGFSDEILQARFDLYQGFDLPLVFTPGDNYWFDCQRLGAGGYDTYERLVVLRAMFFPTPELTTEGRRMAVETQSHDPDFEEFVENAMWTKEGVVFTTFHILGVKVLAIETSYGCSRELD
tara:strand:- start:593 stop:1045 length:453 start_codon:yes stop_codon:yes gene_type:complete